MIYHFGPYQLDAQHGELRCANHPVEIEPKVFDVLVYLASPKNWRNFGRQAVSHLSIITYEANQKTKVK
jgi:hypothetical protein